MWEPTVLGCSVCHNIGPHWVVSTADIHCLTIPEARSERCCCQQGCFHLRGTSSAWTWPSSLCVSRGLPSALPCVLPSSSKDTGQIRFRPTNWIRLTLMTCWKTKTQMQTRGKVLGVAKSWHIGGHNSDHSTCHDSSWRWTPTAGGRTCTCTILRAAGRFQIQRAVAGTLPTAVSDEGCCPAPSRAPEISLIEIFTWPTSGCPTQTQCSFSGNCLMGTLSHPSHFTHHVHLFLAESSGQIPARRSPFSSLQSTGIGHHLAESGVSITRVLKSPFV